MRTFRQCATRKARTAVGLPSPIIGFGGRREPPRLRVHVSSGMCSLAGDVPSVILTGAVESMVRRRKHPAVAPCSLTVTMRSVVAIKNKAAESAGNVRDKWTSHPSGQLNLPDPYHARRAKFAPQPADAQPAQDDDRETRIDWANLPRHDKDVFFSWLDEFFARYQHPSKQPPPAAPPPAPRRPPLPESSSTTAAAPTTNARVAARPPVPAVNRAPSPPSADEDELPTPVPNKPPPPPRAAPRPPPPAASKPMKPQLQSRQSEPAPPPVAWQNRPPPVSMATKPAGPAPVPVTAEPVYEEDDEEDGWCTAHRDFSAADEHASYFPRENARSIAALAYDLASPFDDPVDKARVIFTWMHHNITYDVANFLAGTVKHGLTADDTLRTGMAVCEGYSGLYSALALAAGLECISVHGHGKGFGYAPPPPGTHPAHLPAYNGNHAWNAVKLDGEWRLMDSTWGAGAIHGSSYLKRFVSNFFCGATGLAHNAEFGRRHFPSEPEHQFIAPDRVIGWEEYILLPERPRIMGDFETLGYSETLLRPATRVLDPGRHHVVLKRYCVHVPETEEGAYVPIVWLEGHPRHMAPLALHPYGWTIDLDLSNARGQVFRIAVVKSMNSEDALGAGREAYERARGRQAMQFGFLAEWDVAS